MNNAELPQQYESWTEFYEAVKHFEVPVIYTPVEKEIYLPMNCNDTPDSSMPDVHKWTIDFIISKVKDELFRIYLEEQRTQFTYDELYQLRMLTSHQGYTDLMYKVDRKMALESDRRFKKRLAGY